MKNHCKPLLLAYMAAFSACINTSDILPLGTDFSLQKATELDTICLNDAKMLNIYSKTIKLKNSDMVPIRAIQINSDTLFFSNSFHNGYSSYEKNCSKDTTYVILTSQDIANKEYPLKLQLIKRPEKFILRAISISIKSPEIIFVDKILNDSANLNQHKENLVNKVKEHLILK